MSTAVEELKSRVASSKLGNRDVAVTVLHTTVVAAHTNNNKNPKQKIRKSRQHKKKKSGWATEGYRYWPELILAFF